MSAHTPDRSTASSATSSSPSSSFDSSADGDDGDVGSEAAERFVHEHPFVVDVARVGWTAKGVVYFLTGVLAFVVAWGPLRESRSGDGQANLTGAITEIGEQPFGRTTLWTMAVGLLVYALWRFVTVILPAGTGVHAILRRIGYAISGMTYAALAFTAITLARRSESSGGGGSQDSRVSDATADVLAWTGGRYLVGLTGLVVIGVAAYFLWKALRASFESDLEHRSIGPFSWKMIRLMGRAGWIGRATMMALIGVSLMRAAIQFDASGARGLDASLHEVASASIGTVLVYVIAVGLMLYGAFCVISTPIRKLVATDDDTVSS